MDNWEWPQWAVAVLMAVNLLFAAHMHGEPRGDYNFLDAAIAVTLTSALLYFGGFWG